MINEIKKDLRARIQYILDCGNPMDSKDWNYEEGVLLSGADALALLNELERLEVKWEYYKESRDELLEKIKEMGSSIKEVKK